MKWPHAPALVLALAASRPALAGSPGGSGAPDHAGGRVLEIQKNALERVTRVGSGRDRDVGRRALVGLGETAIPAVEGLLRDPRPPVRRLAVSIRGEIGGPGAGPVLSAALQDPDWGVRTAASVALGQLPDPFSPEPLIAGLRDPMWTVRAACAWSLRMAPADRAAAPLVGTALGDPDPDVRDAAFQSLRALQSPLATPAFVTGFPRFDSERKEQALRAVAAFGDASSIPFLRRVLGETSRLLRLLALRRLIELGDRSPLQDPVVIADLLDAASASASTAEEQRIAVDTLERLGTPALPHIHERLIAGAGDPSFDPEPLLKLVASLSGEDWIEALAALPGEPALAALRPSIYARLGSAQDRSALPFLLQEAKGPRSPEERRRLVEALCRFDDPGIREALLAALCDSQPEVALRAMERLLEFGDAALVRAVGKAIAAMREPAARCRALSLFSTVTSPEAVPLLMNFLGNEDASVREAALLAISVDRGEPARASLLKKYPLLLNGETNLRVRRAIVNNLGILGGPEAKGILLRVLRYPYEATEVRLTALQRLAFLDPVEIHEDLLSILADEQAPIDLQLSAIRKLRPLLQDDLPLDLAARIEALLRSAIDERGDPAVAALEALRGARPAPLVRLTVETASNPDLNNDLRSLAIEALGAMRAAEARAAVSTLVRAPTDPRTAPLRLAAIRALADRPDPESVAIVQEALGQAEAELLGAETGAGVERTDHASRALEDAESRLRECLRCLSRIAPDAGAVEIARLLLARATLQDAAGLDITRFARDVASSLRTVPEASVVRRLRDAVNAAKADGRIYRIPEEVFFGIARELERNGLPQSAALFARLVLDTSPAYSRNDIEAARALGVWRERAGRYVEAARAFELASRIAKSEGYLLEEEDRDRGSVPEQALQAAAYLLRGLDHFRDGKPDLALDAFTRALFVAADDWSVHVACARDLLVEGRFLDLALSAARRADKLSPSNPDVLWTLAEVQDRMGSSEEAAASLRRLLLDTSVTERDKARVLLRLAALYVKLDRKVEALSALQRAVRFDPALLPEVEEDLRNLPR